MGDGQFRAVGPRERRFFEALIALEPTTLSPILTQIGSAKTCDDGNGWLVVRNACGDPCAWAEDVPFDVVPPAVSLGPHGCYSIMLWFNGFGQIRAVELLMLGNETIDLDALSFWLEARAASRDTRRDFEHK